MNKDTLLLAGVVLSLLLSGYAAVQSHRAATSISTQPPHNDSSDDEENSASDTETVPIRESALSNPEKAPEPDPLALSPSRHGASSGAVAPASRPSSSRLSALTPAEKKVMEEAIDDAVEARLKEREQEEKKKEKNRERTKWGEWKASIDDLAEDLNLDSEQKEKAGQIFDQAREKFAKMLDVKRPNGTSVLSDFAEDLKSGVLQEEAHKEFEYAIQHDLVPGTEDSILSELLLIKDDVVTQLSEHLDRDQITEYKKLKVDSLQVGTGYDPIRDYIVDYMKE